jgi:hypothetical protein
MGIKEFLLHGLGQLTAERPGQQKSFAEWRAVLVSTGAEIEQRAANAKNSAASAAALRHITGIERWGQNRLRVFLGAPYVRDEYDSYQPGAALDLPGQVAAFAETRAETVVLCEQLEHAGLAPDAAVEHNDFGPLSARGWLAYLSGHAGRERMRIR